MTMQTGFRQLPVDLEFARRSARYLADQGYLPPQIQSALVEQLNVTASSADAVVAAAMPLAEAAAATAA